MITVRLFASAARAAGVRSVDLDADTVDDALTQLRERFSPALATVLETSQVAAGDDIVPPDDSTPLPAGTTVAILPPFSGGQDLTMIDVGARFETRRTAVAVAEVFTTPATRDRILEGEVEKGDAVGAARVAAILAVKRTPELLPLCHPVRTTGVEVSITATGERGLRITVTVSGVDRTGFEMEALTGAAVAALTLVDMAKREDPAICVASIRILEKRGGTNGEWVAP